MTQELNDKLKAQIEQILAEKLPEQGSPALTKLKEKAMTRLRERLPYVLVPLAIDLILSPDDKQLGERIAERFRYVLTALIIEVILSTVHEELEKLGRSKPCKHLTPIYAPLCGKGKEWGSLCLTCGDYGPMEEW